MKTKHGITIYIFGIIIALFGALLMYYHHPWAKTAALAGNIIQLAGGLVFLYKLLTYPRLKDFLNW